MKLKVIITFLVLLTVIGKGYSQVVTTDPEFPLESDSVTIYFHADEGNQGLMDYDGDIYAHTGVITNESTGPSNWKYVIAEWSENTDKAQLTKVSDNLYKLKISPSINEFYGVEEEDTVLQMAFVFRNSDGSKTGREADAGDIYADVYQAGLNLSITSPSNDYIIQSGEQIRITASSNESDSMILLIDNVEVTKVTGTGLDYLHTENVDGLHQIKIIAKNTTEEIADSVNYFVRGSIPEADLPEGWVKGINYLADDSVGLVLFAPNKEIVFVIGDFNNWVLDEDYIMNRTPDGEYYWLSIGNLNTQHEYIFQYYIDGEIRIADPYTEKTSDPNDKYITEETYPGILDYPESKTTEVASVLELNQQEYVWENTGFVAPEKKNLIIYELLVRDFLANHDYETLIDTLDYLDSLGINAVELMPINEFEGNESWGYNPSFYFAPDKYYGPKEDLKAFIDSCHGRSIAVIIDMVLNHSYSQSPLVQMYFDAGAGDYGQPTAENPWYNQTSPNTSYSWGHDFNHESDYTREFVDSVNTFWLENYKVDGFRFDFTKGFTNTSGDGWAYDGARIAILKRMADEIWEVNSDAYVILEHLADNTEEKELSDYGIMLWGNINHEYSNATKGKDSDITWGSYKERGWTNPYLISYMESHDEERLVYGNITYGDTYGSYDITELSTALSRIELAANFFIPIPGPKMIWQFGELGYDISIDYNGRVGNKPIHWEYFNEDDRFRIYQVYKTLNNLKQNYDVFKTTDFTINEDGKAKTINLYDDEMNVVIVGNFDLTTLYVSTTFPATGDWYELYSGDTLTISNTEEMIKVRAGEYRFYTDIKLTQPDLPTSIFNERIEYLRAKVYPNPSSDWFRFDVGSGMIDAELYIYNSNGQLEVKQKIERDNIIEFDATNLRTGIYFYKLFSSGKVYSGKLIKN